jgi:salicylate hydroxylase
MQAMLAHMAVTTTIESNNRVDRPLLTVCSKCRGEGKRSQIASKKARKRHKLSDQQHQQSPPLRIDGCKTCGGSGLVEQSHGDDQPCTIANNYMPHVGIVGGGLGGLALAVACRHRGIPCTVYEKDDDFYQRSQGYGLTMQQASRALKSLGIPVPLKDGIVSTKHQVHTPDGRVVGEWGLRKWLGPNGKNSEKATNNKRQNVHIARQALRYELLQALGGSSQVQWGHRLVGFTEQEDQVELNFEVSRSPQSEDGTVTNGHNDSTHKTTSKNAKVSLLVGADGIRSSVRQKLLGEEKTPLRYLGCIVILGICPLTIEEVNNSQSPLLDGETVFQTSDGSTRIYMMPYSNKEYMWQLSFPMDEPTAKALSRRGPQALKEESIKMCQGWHNPIPAILQQTPSSLVSGYPVYDRELLTQELLSSSSLSSRVTLLGDAAHPMSPFKGQGANQALLDSLSLARLLYKSFGTEDAITNKDFPSLLAGVLETFEEEMCMRSSVKVEASAKAAHFLHTEIAIQEGNVTRGAAASSIEHQ